MTSFNESKYIYYYIVFFITDIFKETSIAVGVVGVVGISDLGQRILQHIVVDIQFINDEVDIEDYAYDCRNKSLGRSRLEVDKLNNRGHSDIEDGYLMNFVHCRIHLGCMFDKPTALLALAQNNQTYPT